MLPWTRRMFPGTNLQDLNLDWILKKFAALRGGAADQVLTKKSSADFDFEWRTGGGGSAGATFIPSVSNAGVISWTNDGGLPNPDPVNIKGPRGNKGDAGPGLPSGGEVGQIPVKSGAADYATVWRYPLDQIQNVATASEDLDSYTTGGYYYFQAAYTPLNKPADSGPYGFLIVLHGTANTRLTQVWIDTASNIIYSRTNSTLTVSWSEWARLTNFDSVLADAVTVDTLPTGVSYAAAKYVQNGPFVQVYFYITRTEDAMTSWQTVCTGLPPVVSTVSIKGGGVPSGQWSIGGPENTRPLILLVTSSGALRVARGENAGNYIGSFCYIAK